MEAEHSEPPQPESPQRFSPAAKPMISPDLEVEDIKRLRRTYALANHPDRVPVDLRDEASKAMAQANAEFDRALRSARSRKDVSD